MGTGTTRDRSRYPSYLSTCLLKFRGPKTPRRPGGGCLSLTLFVEVELDVLHVPPFFFCLFPFLCVPLLCVWTTFTVTFTPFPLLLLLHLSVLSVLLSVSTGLVRREDQGSSIPWSQSLQGQQDTLILPTTSLPAHRRLLSPGRPRSVDVWSPEELVPIDVPTLYGTLEPRSRVLVKRTRSGCPMDPLGWRRSVRVWNLSRCGHSRTCLRPSSRSSAK